jgi:hypothetical protein
VQAIEFGFAKMSNGRPANEDDSNKRVDAPGANPAKKRGIYLSLATRLASVPDGLAPHRAEQGRSQRAAGHGRCD